jgi:phosphate transport system substrate-binding protein
MKRNGILAAATMVFLTLTALHAGAAQLEMSGSTTVQKRIIEPAASAIEKATGITVRVRGINSGKGFAELRSGKVTASVSSSPLSLLLEKAGLPDDGTYQEHVITKDVIVPIVHNSNPVSRLSWKQLADINAGRITNWKDVGGPDQKIIVVTSQPTAATRIVFQKQVMKKAPYVSGAREVKSTRQEVNLVARQEVNLVAKYKGGIGAVSESFVAMNRGKVKVIKTKEISRPLSIITRGEPAPEVKSLIDFLRKPEAAKNFK